MTEIVYNKNNQAITNSLIVAEKFGKEHKHVLDAIRDLQRGCAENSADPMDIGNVTDVKNILRKDGVVLIEVKMRILIILSKTPMEEDFEVFTNFGENFKGGCIRRFYGTKKRNPHVALFLFATWGKIYKLRLIRML